MADFWMERLVVTKEVRVCQAEVAPNESNAAAANLNEAIVDDVTN